MYASIVSILKLISATLWGTIYYAHTTRVTWRYSLIRRRIVFSLSAALQDTPTYTRVALSITLDVSP